MEEQQCLACGLQKTVCACVCVCMCTCARIVFDHTPTRKRSLSSFLRICSCDVNRGQVLPPGRILKKHCLCQKNVDMKKQPTGTRHAQRSARSACMCTRGATKRRTSAMERRWACRGPVRWKDVKRGCFFLSFSFFTAEKRLVVTD